MAWKRKRSFPKNKKQKRKKKNEKQKTTTATVATENAFGIIKTFSNVKRAERYQLRQQLKYLAATVANQLAIEIASGIEYQKENVVVKFDLSGRFKSGWLNTPSQIKNTITGGVLTVFEAERYTLGKFIKKLSKDFTIEYDKQYVYFTENQVGVNPAEKITKVEDNLYGVLENLPLSE